MRWVLRRGKPAGRLFVLAALMLVMLFLVAVSYTHLTLPTSDLV